jgi:hypothetical protein
MNKTATLIVALCASFICLTSNARILRIGYPGTPLIGTDYSVTDITSAIDDASPGDTLQLYQQYWSTSGSFTVNKLLHFIGFGYFLDKNPGLQAVNNTTNNTITVAFQTGSEGSTIQGLYGNVYLAASNITVSRCRASIYLGYDINGSSVSGLSNLKLIANYLDNILEYGAGISNVYIANNAILGYNLSNSSGTFTNNIVYNSGSFNSFLIRNNIFINSSPVPGGNTFEYNIFPDYGNGITGTGNQFSIDVSTVFQNYSDNSNFSVFYDYANSDYTDNRMAIIPGSPASGNGKKNDNTNTDMGVFGGEAGELYRLSGIPPVPSIYRLTAPSSTATTNPYTITISVRSNN